MKLRILQSDSFNGRGGKGDYEWLLRADVFESCFVVACTGMVNLNNLEELDKR